MLKLFLDINPSKRIYGKDALNHPWITKNALDPLPINFYQSLIQESIKIKSKQAITAAIFCNYVSNFNRDEENMIIFNSIKKENKSKSNKRIKDSSYIIDDLENNKQTSPLLEKKRLMIMKRKMSQLPLDKQKEKEYEPSLTQIPNKNNKVNGNYSSTKRTKVFDLLNLNGQMNNDDIKSYSTFKPRAKRISTDRIMVKKRKFTVLSPLKSRLPKLARDKISNTQRVKQEREERNEVEKEIKEEGNEKINQSHSSRNYSMMLPIKYESEKKMNVKINTVIRDLNLAKLLRNNKVNIKSPSKRNIIRVNHANIVKLKLNNLCLPILNQ